MKVCLFEPQIPQNFGNIIRFLACFNINQIDVILPTGFVLDAKEVRRSMMDYGKNFEIHKFSSFDEYKLQNKDSRIILFTTKSSENHAKFIYHTDDILLFGAESHGVSDKIHNLADYRLNIPISKSTRSLNLSITVAIAVSFARENLLSTYEERDYQNWNAS